MCSHDDDDEEFELQSTPAAVFVLKVAEAHA